MMCSVQSLPERLFARPTTDLTLVQAYVHLICCFQVSLQCNMWQPLIALMKLHLPMRLVCSLSLVSIFSCFVLISSRSFLSPSSHCCSFALLVAIAVAQEEMEMLQEHLGLIYVHKHTFCNLQQSAKRCCLEGTGRLHILFTTKMVPGWRINLGSLLLTKATAAIATADATAATFATAVAATTTAVATDATAFTTTTAAIADANADAAEDPWS